MQRRLSGNLIRASKLTKIYREGAAELRALQGVDLEVRAGELTMLMGPSGSGKTTLLSILGCILRATEGWLEVLGEDVTALPERELPRIRREAIGFVFQGFNLFPTLTAAENVALALDVRGIRGEAAKRRGEGLLAEVGLGQKARSFPADLSGGQKQRVAIARALAGDPPILLADEPTAALDSTSGRTVIELLQRLAHQSGRAVVMVTHDPRVLPYSDRIIRLEDGRIVREDQRGIHGKICIFRGAARESNFKRLLNLKGKGKTMKRFIYVLSAAGILIVLSAASLLRSRAHAVSANASGTRVVSSAVIAAPGRVEGVSEEVRVSSELSGRLKKVYVEEGDCVQQGQVLAEVENTDYRARVAAAEADLAQREAELRRTVNGSREQERREAEAAKQAAKAIVDNAKSEAERRRGLADRNEISRDEADRYERSFQVARAQYEQAAQHFSLVDAEPREEDRARAEAGVATAKAQLAEARAYLEKSYIRAPLNGVILRKLRHTGESVSTQFDSPVITMADDSTLRVRLDVDEGDVSKLRVGQKAYVVAEAYGTQKFWGRVIRVGKILGKKNVRTDEPSEHVDTKILETLVELDPGQPLPLGLRVDSFVEIQQPDKEPPR